MPWPIVGGLYDKPKTLEELAEKVQLNFDALAGSLPDVALSNAAVIGPGGNALRVVAGEIASNASIVTGSGFTCTKPATGKYEVTFTTGLFTAAPVVVAMVSDIAAGYAAKEFAGTTSSATLFTVATFDSATATAQDAGFYFVAIGAR